MPAPHRQTCFPTHLHPALDMERRTTLRQCRGERSGEPSDRMRVKSIGLRELVSEANTYLTRRTLALWPHAYDGFVTRNTKGN
jgi:hypothetical protein